MMCYFDTKNGISFVILCIEISFVKFSCFMLVGRQTMATTSSSSPMTTTITTNANNNNIDLLQIWKINEKAQTQSSAAKQQAGAAYE
jgi:hypothetical protein